MKAEPKPMCRYHQCEMKLVEVPQFGKPKEMRKVWRCPVSECFAYGPIEGQMLGETFSGNFSMKHDEAWA